MRSSELLVAEGFQVNVAMLPSGVDPDTFIRREGGQRAARSSALRSLTSVPARSGRGRAGLPADEERREFLGRMLEVAARIPDAAARDQFADRLAHRARITEEASSGRNQEGCLEARDGRYTVLDRPKVGLNQVKTAEKGLIWALIHDPAAGTAAMAELDTNLVGLATEPILAQARALKNGRRTPYPQTLLERLNGMEARLGQDISRQPHPRDRRSTA